MSQQIINASPEAILLGVQDVSTRAVPYESRVMPIHMPHLFFYAGWGPEFPLIASGSTAINTYGADVFDARSKYVQHQWPLIERMKERANQFVGQRIIPNDAPEPATIAFAIDVLETDIDEYERNNDGSFKLDVAGNKIPTGTKVPGFRYKWVITECDEGKLGVAKQIPGSLSDKDTNKQSIVYPIFELQTTFKGVQGNNRGVRLWAPTTDSDNPVNSRVVESQLAQIYRIQFVQRDSAMKSPRTIRSLNGEEYVEFSFREDVIDDTLGVEYGIKEVLLSSYTDTNTRGGAPRRWGPFGKIYTYDANLEAVLEMFYAAETQVNDAIAKVDGGQHLINICDGIHYNGVPYHSIEVLGAMDGVSSLNKSSTYYAAGGGDGTMSKELFDEAVGNICLDYAESEFNLVDDAKYPQSVIYDTGFSMTNKFKMLSVLSARKDMLVILSTQDIALPQNDMRQESSVAVSLATQARLHPESDYYGTPVYRAAIVGHSGYLINSKYRKLVPMTVDLADKLAAFAGSGTGRMDEERMPDVNPNNLVNLLRDVNVTFKPSRTRNKDWDNGLIWVQSFDQDDVLFYPALQTAYPNDTSVLNSLLTAMISVELEKVCSRSWRRMTGRSDLTNAQFAKRIDEIIQELTERRFANRVVVRSETYYTKQDEMRGYSWTTRIMLYANNMKTVGTFTIESHRREELED